MKAENLAGYDYECSTVQDLIDHLMMLTPKTRRSSYIQLQLGMEIYDLTKVSFAQSDQMEKHELKVYLCGNSADIDS